MNTITRIGAFQSAGSTSTCRKTKPSVLIAITAETARLPWCGRGLARFVYPPRLACRSRFTYLPTCTALALLHHTLLVNTFETGAAIRARSIWIRSAISSIARGVVAGAEGLGRVGG